MSKENLIPWGGKEVQRSSFYEGRKKKAWKMNLFMSKENLIPWGGEEGEGGGRGKSVVFDYQISAQHRKSATAILVVSKAVKWRSKVADPGQGVENFLKDHF